MTASKHVVGWLTSSIIIPMAVKAVIELGIPDILAKVKGGKPLSALEILAKLPTKTTPGPNSASNLRRLMTPLVQGEIFSETLNEEKEIAYGLTEFSQLLVRDHEWSMVPFSAFMFSRTFRVGLSQLQEVILDEDKIPFAAEWGMSFYEYGKKNPEFGAMFDKAMTAMIQPELKGMVGKLQKSGWLDGVRTFVDVGGGQGLIASRVAAQNPQIQAINFDVPQVVERAPEAKGVQNQGGDFFEAVPSGDVLFLKLIMHNYDDETCVKILTKCFEALPKGGKVIIAENIVIDSDKSPKSTFNSNVDLIMLGLFKGAKERTEEDYRKILSTSGFSRVNVLLSSTDKDLIQGIKE